MSDATALPQQRLELRKSRRQQRHRFVGANLRERRRRFFYDVDVHPARRRLLERGELAIDSFVRHARTAMHDVDEIAQVVRIDVRPHQLALQFVQRRVASGDAVRFDEAEEGAAAVGFLFAAELSEQRLQPQ